MIFDVHRESLDGRVHRGALGHGPTLQGAADLEAEVVMEAARGMALNTEDLVAVRARRRHLGARFRRPFKFSFSRVIFERHGP